LARSNFIVRGGADFSGIKKELTKTQKQLGSFQKGIGKSMSGLSKGVKLALGYVSIRAIAGFVKATTKLASDLTEVQNVVDVTFAEMSKDINDFADIAINQFGLSELSAKKYSSSMGAMLKSSGIAGEAVRDMAVDLTKLSADMASFYNLANDDAFQKILSGMSGMTRPLKELGINMSIANVEAFALSKGIKKSWQQMSQAEQTMARYQYLMSVTSDAQGDFSRTAHTWANQTKILSQQFDVLKGTIGAGFINALMPIVKIMNALIKYFQMAAQSFKALTTTIFGDAEASSQGGVVVENLSDIEDGLDGVSEAGKQAKKALAGFDEINTIGSGDTEEASTFTAGVLGGSTDVPQPDVSWAGNVKGVLSDLMNFISKKLGPSIAGWGDAFKSLKKPISNAFKDVKKSMSNLWSGTLKPYYGYLVSDWAPGIANGFSDTFAPIFSDVMPVLLSEFALEFDFACQQIDRTVKDVFAPAMNFMKGVALDAFDSIKNTWDERGANILEGFQSFRQGVRDVWDSLYANVFKPVFGYIGDTVDWLWDKHLKKLWDNITDFVGSVAEFVLMLWNQILKPAVDWIVERVGPPIAFVVGMIGDVFGTVFAVIADVVGGIIKRLTGVMDFITGVFTGDWEKAWGGIKDIFEGIWDTIYGVVKGIINLIIDGLNMLWGGIYMGAKGVVDSIGGIAGAIGKIFGQDWKFSLPPKVPKIPKLASGGIAYGRSIVEVGEYANARSNPEIISPLDKLKEMIADVAGGDIYLTTSVVLDDGTLVGSAKQKIARGNRLVGKPAMGV
jgi:phage-related protein